MAISQNFPNTRPSLNLNFARSKRLDPRITFTRTSTATYIDEDGLLKTVSVNQPRFDHNPTTGESLGLLIEESRTNLYSNSNDFTVWTQQTSGVGANGITPNAIVSPDGTTNASRYFVQTGGSTFYAIYRSFTAAANTYYTYSVFAKAGEFNLVGFTIFDGTNNSSAQYNLSTGTVVYTSPAANMTFGTVSILNYGNGWYRCILPFSHSVGGSFTPKIDLGGTTLNSGMYLYGVQMEQGAFPTSYIPTLASTVTRSADNASITGTNFSSWYNQSEGTLLTAHQAYQQQVTSFDRVWSITDGTANNNLAIYYSANAQRVDALKTLSGVNNFIAGRSTPGHNLNNKTIFIYSNTECGSTSGGQTLSSSSISGSFAATQLNIGASEFLFRTRIYISQLLYYPFRLSNSQLQELTK